MSWIDHWGEAEIIDRGFNAVHAAGERRKDELLNFDDLEVQDHVRRSKIARGAGYALTLALITYATLGIGIFPQPAEFLAEKTGQSVANVGIELLGLAAVSGIVAGFTALGGDIRHERRGAKRIAQVKANPALRQPQIPS